MNRTPVANRLQIGIFGRRNAGKSSLINALTGQNTAIVDTTPGTTTDPVGKAMEIAGIGPVFIYDTAGIDDEGDLGLKRVARTKEVIHKINLAIVVTTFSTFDKLELDLIDELKKSTDVIVVFNKIDVDVKDELKENTIKQKEISCVSLSCTTGKNIEELRKLLVQTGSKIHVENSTIIGDLVKQGDVVMLVVPIDLGAPKGRLILPQVQVIRDLLDNDTVTVTVKERELAHALSVLKNPPALVICDSQVILKVSGDVPDSVPLTTFSILFSRLKGDFKEFVNGTRHIDKLKDGDRVLIMEACTHHAQSDDIGRVKIPRWIRQYTGKNLEFDTVAGPYMDKDLSKYNLIISCGACMINRKEMLSRIDSSKTVSIPITNYGMAISFTQGVFERVVKPFKVL
ncbi:MAG: [FeFe] hydrogenase H-cluster maturation GTPase HydF [Candidatus Goldiibacteriota bacterium HGW-Goldbacteria-1]|jgi:[FeFe] hydrogenase H-cluster maturation GTPase HydF|nr:MAG: [FeFe] hydrogenase H-cluster maturation GTPase HydF [Candidatus Goldiibacteriota bacterium HGW-Goldbacteria-1]